MVKGWNRANGKPVKPSFLVEVMAEDAVCRSPVLRLSGRSAQDFFAAMEANLERILAPDPAGLGPPVSDQMTPDLITAAWKGLTGGTTQCNARDAGGTDRPAGRCAADLARRSGRLFSAVVEEPKMGDWSLIELLSGLHEEIQGRLAIARKAIGHPVAKGDASEEVWLELLKNYLPHRYQAAKAFVVDSSGRFSEQIDVLVFDRQYSPFIFKYNGQTIVPCRN